MTVESDWKTPVKSIWAHVYMENPICLAPQMSASISRIKSFSSQTVFTWIRLESFKPILSWISSQSSQLCGLTLAVRFDQFFQSSSCKYNMGGLTWTPNPLFYHSTFLSLTLSSYEPSVQILVCNNNEHKRLLQKLLKVDYCLFVSTLKYFC